mgnify:CR=1 FL=1
MDAYTHHLYQVNVHFHASKQHICVACGGVAQLLTAHPIAWTRSTSSYTGNKAFSLKLVDWMEALTARIHSFLNDTWGGED